MQINLQAKNMELTSAIRDYVYKRITDLEKFLSAMEDGGGEAMVNFEVGRATLHHKSGFVFHCDCLVSIDGSEFYASSDQEDLYAAVDAVQAELYEKIRRYKERDSTLFIRGARSVKKMLKGLSKRNPFTAKY